MTTTDATTIATDFYADLEKAWNAADGAGFGARFGDGSWFVDIRGTRHVGGALEIGASHQGIFDTIYKGSEVRYALTDARSLGDGVILATAVATMHAPGGPLAGEHHAVSTTVLVHGEDGWSAASFHNTLVTG